MHLIEPVPPTAQEALPHVGTGLRFLQAPTDYLNALRQRHGDTFFLDVFGFPLLVTFSEIGLRNLYRLEEDTASFGLATFDLIGFKTPSEIFQDADTQLFYSLLLNKRMPAYVATIDSMVDMELQRWGDRGELDIFDAIRTLEQRVGYGLWIAPEAAESPYWEALKSQFDVLDQETAFVSPQAILETIRTDKSAERAALTELKLLIAEITQVHNNNSLKTYATLDFLQEHFAASDETVRARQVAHSIVNTNQGFLSNLYAAIAWVIVRLLQYPEAMTRVQSEIDAVRERYGEAFRRTPEALNEMVYLEQVMMESVRLAQRSITLRKVIKPVQFDVGDTEYTVQPGVYITTMLSVTNTQNDELRRFDPDHYQRNQPGAALLAPGKETVSTFGHGKHACPAQRFSHHMCKIVVSKLLTDFTLKATFTDEPKPSPTQMGGVARPATTTMVSYLRKT